MLWGYMWLFLKENSRSFVSSQRGCFLVAFLHTFMESLRFFNMLYLNAIMWFQDYFLGFAVYLVPIFYNRMLRLFYCHLYLMYLFLVWSLSAILPKPYWFFDLNPPKFTGFICLFSVHIFHIYIFHSWLSECYIAWPGLDFLNFKMLYLFSSPRRLLETTCFLLFQLSYMQLAII